MAAHTRRTLLTRAALAGGLAALRAPAALAAPSGVFTVEVGRLAGESAPLAPGRPFVLAGVEWSAPARPAIELRVRARDGRWSRWARAAVAGHAPDGEPASTIGEPLWTGEADLVQLRGAAHGVRLHLVAVSPRAARDSSLPLALPLLDTGGGQPPIIARSAWAGAGAAPRFPPAYGDVRLAFVHHTENPNGYSAAQVPAMLLAIFLFHRDVRGWHDIGYNFVVDAFGRIWEARRGGIDAAVIGAQAGGYNAVSAGVAVLGSFQGRVPSPAAMNALRRLLAWKLALHGVPPRGRVVVTVNPADAFYTPFAPGARVTLPRIAGHRDGDSTDCPGDALYRRLGRLRLDVARTIGADAARLQLTGSPSAQPVVAGAPLTLSGRLTLQGGAAPPAGSVVELQRLDGGGAQPLAQAATEADGAFTVRLVLDRSALVRALHRAPPAAVSVPLAVSVAPLITLAVSGAGPFSVSGAVRPAKSAVNIDLYAAGARGGLTALLARVPAAVAGDGSFSATVSPPGPGAYALVAHTAADTQNAAGASAPAYVTA